MTQDYPIKRKIYERHDNQQPRQAGWASVVTKIKPQQKSLGSKNIDQKLLGCPRR